MTGILCATFNSSEESGEGYSPSSTNIHLALSKFEYCRPSFLMIKLPQINGSSIKWFRSTDKNCVNVNHFLYVHRYILPVFTFVWRNYKEQSSLSETLLAHEIKKYKGLYGTKISLLCSKQSTAESCSEPDESRLYPQAVSLWSTFNIILSHMTGLQNGLFPSGLPTKFLYASPVNHIRNIHKDPINFVITEVTN
jgi:hypothetical protein